MTFAGPGPVINAAYRQDERTRNSDLLLTLLHRHCTHGRSCPPSSHLASELGISAGMIETLFKGLRKDGLVEWHTLYVGGTGGSRRKHMHLLDTDEWLARPVAMTPVVHVHAGDNRLELAKDALRAHRHYVWNASIVGGPCGMIRVDHEWLTEEEVIAMAERERAHGRA